jgi:hypothetical protein
MVMISLSFVYYEPYLIFLAGHKVFWIAVPIISHYQVKLSLSTAHNNRSTPTAIVDDVPDTSSTFIPKYNESIASANAREIIATMAWTRMSIENVIESADYKKTIYYQGDYQRGDHFNCFCHSIIRTITEYIFACMPHLPFTLHCWLSIASLTYDDLN